MPELPEVETCRRALEPLVIGRVLGAYAHSGKALRIQDEPQRLADLSGQRITALTRRSKYLIAELEQDALLVHLGMTGQLFVSDDQPAWLPHEHWRFAMGDGALRYRDPRRFGMVMSCSLAELPSHAMLAKLGPEPLDGWQAEQLVAATRGRRTPIKTMIMDAKTVVGVGNIYAAEALFAAGIHPFRAAGRISPAHIERLHAEIVSVLERALAEGGSTVKDFVSSDGAPGYFAHSLAVYGRHGQPCLRCETALKREQRGGRTTVYCGRCQR